MLIRITSNYFCAGLILGERAAPIISYMKNWSFDEILNYCNKKKWLIEWKV